MFIPLFKTDIEKLEEDYLLTRANEEIQTYRKIKEKNKGTEPDTIFKMFIDFSGLWKSWYDFEYQRLFEEAVIWCNAHNIRYVQDCPHSPFIREPQARFIGQRPASFFMCDCARNFKKPSTAFTMLLLMGYGIKGFIKNVLLSYHNCSIKAYALVWRILSLLLTRFYPAMAISSLMKRTPYEIGIHFVLIAGSPHFPPEWCRQPRQSQSLFCKSDRLKTSFQTDTNIQQLFLAICQ